MREKNVEINEAVKTRLSMTNWRHATLQTHFVEDTPLAEDTPPLVDEVTAI